MAKKIADHRIPSQAAQWVRASLGGGATILETELLPGATSSTLHRLQISQPGREYPVVLRRFTNADWLAEEPDLVFHEVKSLDAASQIGIPVPDVIAYDQHGAESGLPAVLMTHLPGGVILQPPDMDEWLIGLAEMLVPIHQVDAGDFPWEYFTYNDFATMEPPQWSTSPGLWTKAREILQENHPQSRVSFIHRDYHPTNVLWENNHPSGVVDWVNACLGPPGIDLGHCRLNLVQLYGVEAADRFLDAYLSLSTSSYEHHPYWDLLTLIDFPPGPTQMYQGWLDHGFPLITGEDLTARLEDYFVSAVEKF